MDEGELSIWMIESEKFLPYVEVPHGYTLDQANAPIATTHCGHCSMHYSRFPSRPEAASRSLFPAAPKETHSVSCLPVPCKLTQPLTQTRQGAR